MNIETNSLAANSLERKRPLPVWVVWALFLLLPLLSLFVWEALWPDEAYLSLRFAQTLGSREAFIAQWQATSLGYSPVAPLAWLVLAIPEWLGWQSQLVASVLSVLGWGITAVFWQKILRVWRLSLVDWLVPLLLVVSPVVVLSRGSFVSWFAALAWLAVLLTVQEKWRLQTIVLLLLPLMSLSITAVSLIVILFVWRLVMTRKMAWLAGGLLAVVCLLALAGIGWQGSRAPWLFSFPFADWLSWGQQWSYAEEFVWLFLLFALVAVVTRRQTWPIAIWLIVALLDMNLVGHMVVASGLLFLTGVGIAEAGQWLTQRDWFDLPDEKVYLGAVLLMCIPLAWVMWRTLRNRPEDLSAISDAVQAGAWLHENSEADAVVLGDPAVGYFANRTVWVWNGRSTQQNWAAFIRRVEPLSPNYIISDNSLFWDGLIHQDWWQDRYKSAEIVGSHIIWRYVPQPALTAPTVPLNVVLENGVKLVGYQQSPQSIKPGDAVNVSLHFQVEEPIKNGFGTVVWLPSPVDGANQALQDLLTPRAVPSNWWEPGQIVTEQFVLTTTEQIPVGGYRLTLSFRTQDNFIKMPVYQNEDVNPLDRIQLGYVAVPWTGEISGSAQPYEMALGNEFKLLAAEIPANRAKPGEELGFRLYWEGINPNRPQHNYTIFVHLLNEAGEMVANADGPPQGGLYPTGAWALGDVVIDDHRLYLPPDLAPGNYKVHVGAYLLETGERLPVFDAGGSETPGASVLLMDLTVE